LEEGVENERKMMWRREELNEFNIVELGERNALWIRPSSMVFPFNTHFFNSQHSTSFFSLIQHSFNFYPL